MSPRSLVLPLLFCLHVSAFAQAAYTLVFGPENSSPAAIDRSGRIAGQVAGRADRLDGSSAAFLYAGGALRDIGQLGSASAGAGVNARGQVAGTWVDAAGENHAFMYTDGAMRDIGNLGAASARATGINAAGTVVGSSFTAGFGAVHAFLYLGGGMRDLGTLGGLASLLRRRRARLSRRTRATAPHTRVR